ncbi:MAG: glycoside hydrolase family 99-like domain-containing protein, partial [Armatimonadota bacterium]
MLRIVRRSVIGALASVLAGWVGMAAAAEYTVGAHYYPWYGANNFHSPAGIISAIRWYLLPAQQPALGWYDSQDPQAISAHFLWARGAGIDFFICSYWGSTDDTALTIKNYMLPNADIGDLKLCVMFDGNPTSGPITKDNVASETLWLCDNLFGNPGYLRIDGKPMVMAYDVIKLSDSDLATYCSNIRSAASVRGYQVYLVGDEAYGNLPRSSPTRSNATRCANFDAVMSYNQYSMLRTYGAGKYASQTSVNLWDANNGAWKSLANSAGVSYFPCVEPGFNDSEVRGNHHTPMSRKLGSDNGPEGSLFSAQLDKATSRCDRGIILVTTWNEWHEDTQIEPCVPAGAVTSAIDTNLPYQLMPGETGSPTTGGLNYVGYDTTYLDILRAKTSDVPVPPAAPSNPSSADITTSSITWTWQDNSTNETGFRVYADAGSGMPASLRAELAAGCTAWVHSGLASNTRYSFQVCASNGASPSLRSPIHTAVTLADRPTVGVNVVCDRNPDQAYASGTSFVFANPMGFGGE